uniref:FBD domain-containing protein n=1 Tax=Ditylenchus dipsaci TaxID=166011 RepID=A0A915D6A3_9BILA
MIRLDRDLLYEIAEKMVVGQAAGSDDGKSRMQVSLFSQFSKVERFVLTSSPGSYFYVHHPVERSILWRLRKGQAFLSNRKREKQSEDVVDLKKLSAMKCLCVSVGTLRLRTGLGKLPLRDLLLEKLCVVDKACSLAHLDNILALNSKQLEVSIDGVSGLHCLPENRNYQSVNCSRTETLSLVYISDCCCRDDEFPVSEWIDLLRYILACCPILKKLVSYKLHENCRVTANTLCDCFLLAIKAVKEDVLPHVLRDGCFIRVEFAAHPHLCIFEGYPGQQP